MKREDIVRLANESGLRPWVIWLVVHGLRFILLFIWLFSLPILILTYIPDICKEAYDDWRYLLKSINSIHAKVIREKNLKKMNKVAEDNGEKL